VNNTLRWVRNASVAGSGRSFWLVLPLGSLGTVCDVPAMGGSSSFSTVSPTGHRAPPFCDTETVANPCCPLPNCVTPTQRREQRCVRISPMPATYWWHTSRNVDILLKCRCTGRYA
jgi:hypothetical protein